MKKQIIAVEPFSYGEWSKAVKLCQTYNSNRTLQALYFDCLRKKIEKKIGKRVMFDGHYAITYDKRERYDLSVEYFKDDKLYFYAYRNIEN